MKRYLATMAMAVVATAGMTDAAKAGGLRDIDVRDDFFSPQGYGVDVDHSTFFWRWGNDVVNEHSIRSNKGMFSSGAPTDDPEARFGPIDLPAGSYRYHCSIHGSAMRGNITSLPIEDDDVSRDVVPIRWAAASGRNPVGEVFDVRYRIGKGEWRFWHRNTTKKAARFGADDDPVDYDPNRTYEVSARTKVEKGSLPRSGWSPNNDFPD